MPIRRSPNGARHVRPQPGRNPRNGWSRSIGTPGRNQLEQVVAITRCGQKVVGPKPICRVEFGRGPLGDADRRPREILKALEAGALASDEALTIVIDCRRKLKAV